MGQRRRGLVRGLVLGAKSGIREKYETNPILPACAECARRTRDPPSHLPGCAECAKGTRAPHLPACAEMYKTNPRPSPSARLCGTCKTNPSRIWQVADLDAILLHKAKGKRILGNKAKFGLTGDWLWHFFSRDWAPRIRGMSLRLNCSRGQEPFRRFGGAGRWLRGLDAVGCRGWKGERRLVTDGMTDGCRSRLTPPVEKGAKGRQKWRRNMVAMLLSSIHVSSEAECECKTTHACRRRPAHTCTNARRAPDFAPA